MKIQTYSVLVGSRACDGHCPYCVSKMTPAQGVGSKKTDINLRNFEIGCRFAKDSGVSTVLLTGKGEPTLSPEDITFLLCRLIYYKFPFIDLQTNGISLFQKKEEYNKHLKDWYSFGLSTIAVSIVHYENAKNKEIFQPKGDYLDLINLISFLHSFGFSIRLSCTMFKGGIDNPDEIKHLIEFAKRNKVEQLSIRPVARPEKSEDQEIAEWVSKHELETRHLAAIEKFLTKEGNKLLELVHGAVVYDVYGQNICLTNALTKNPSPEEVRQLIFFPDGHLRYDWQYPGAILL